VVYQNANMRNSVLEGLRDRKLDDDIQLATLVIFKVSDVMRE